MTTSNYMGHLLLANPNNPRNEGYRSVHMIVTHLEHIAVGLQINNPHRDLTLSRVSHNIGIDHEGEAPVYFGGSINQHKIHVIHSLDWSGVGTVPLTDNIGLTNDVSVLIALAQKQGPKYYRACAGYYCWDEGRLDIEVEGSVSLIENPYRWELLPATIENTFEYEPNEQWTRCLEAVARHKVSAWL